MTPQIIVVRERKPSTAAAIGRLGVGVGIGFGLYLLVTGLGFGGLGRGEKGEGRGVPPPKPKGKVLTFRLGSKGIEDLETGMIVDAVAAIRRVLAENQDQVNVIVTGAAIQDDVNRTVRAFQATGIVVNARAGGSRTTIVIPPFPFVTDVRLPMPTEVDARVSGNARGEYGRRYA